MAYYDRSTSLFLRLFDVLDCVYGRVYLEHGYVVIFEGVKDLPIGTNRIEFDCLADIALLL